MSSYQGGCHCGAIRFRVQGTIDELVECNCSICATTGYLHWEVSPEQFRLETGEEAMVNYQFGTRTSHNYFCSRCGVSPFRRSRSAPEEININARCLEGVGLSGIPVACFDGQNCDHQMAALEQAEATADGE